MSRSLLFTVLIAGLLSAGCGLQGLDFVQDERLRMVAPEDRAVVTPPVEIRWQFDPHVETGAEPNDPSFALLVDRTPQPPGHDLRWYLDDHRDCREDDPACPSWDYLATRAVYLTDEPRFVLDTIAPRVGVARGREHIHDLVVILLDDHGRRIGETAARLTLRLTPRHGD